MIDTKILSLLTLPFYGGKRKDKKPKSKEAKRDAKRDAPGVCSQNSQGVCAEEGGGGDASVVAVGGVQELQTPQTAFHVFKYRFAVATRPAT